VGVLRIEGIGYFDPDLVTVDTLVRAAGYCPWGFQPASQRLLPRPDKGFQNTFCASDERTYALVLEGCLNAGKALL